MEFEYKDDTENFVINDAPTNRVSRIVNYFNEIEVCKNDGLGLA